MQWLLAFLINVVVSILESLFLLPKDSPTNNNNNNNDTDFFSDYFQNNENDDETIDDDDVNNKKKKKTKILQDAYKFMELTPPLPQSSPSYDLETVRKRYKKLSL